MKTTNSLYSKLLPDVDDENNSDIEKNEDNESKEIYDDNNIEDKIDNNHIIEQQEEINPIIFNTLTENSMSLGNAVDLVDYSEKINVFGYEGIYDHFKCLCFFKYENIFDFRNKFSCLTNYTDKFYKEILNSFCQYKEESKNFIK